MRKLFCLFSLLAFISSCGPRYSSVEGRLKFIDFPKLGTTNTSNIGDTLLSKGKLQTRKGFRLNNTVNGDYTRPVIKFQKGEYYLRTETSTHLQYYPIRTDQVTVDGAGVGHRIGFSISKQSGEITGWEISGSRLDIEEVPSVTFKDVSILDETHFKQELVYNGKSGNIARFLYREYSGNMARPAFTQELTYDLSESKVIGFREVRLQVLGTSNTSIKYKVISGFEQED